MLVLLLQQCWCCRRPVLPPLLLLLLLLLLLGRPAAVLASVRLDCVSGGTQLPWISHVLSCCTCGMPR
jgi:hypothetical protein